MTAPTQDPNGFLMGGGAKGAKFETPGTTVTGTIFAEPEMRQQTEFGTGKLLFWDNGDPQMQLVVKIQTTQQDDAEDDGIRALYVKGGFKSPTMQKAIADAVRNSGAKGLAVGGTLTVTYTGNGPSSGAGFPPKQYRATYQAPVAGAAFLSEQAAPTAQPDPWQQPAPAPQQPAPPAQPLQPVTAPPAPQLVTMPDGSQVTPQVAALLQQVQQAQAG